MIADIHHKISPNGSNLTDRLEDNLTGDFFGSMRYIPFNRGLKLVLADCIYPHDLASKIMNVDCEFWNKNITFWPYDQEGEIDVLIEFPEIIIGIEVKFLRGLSSDDDISNETAAIDDIEQFQLESSRQQLARESRIISRRGTGKEKILILVADEAIDMSAYNNTISRNIIAPGVRLAAISWQDILVALTKRNSARSDFEQLIIDDLQQLLIEKGFMRFNNFLPEKELSVDDSLHYCFDSVPFSFRMTKHEVEEGLYYEFK